MPPAWSERFDLLIGLRNNWQTVRVSPGADNRRTIDVVARPLDCAPPSETPRGCTLRRVESFDARIDDFWREASLPYRMIVARTKDYLNYRYADRRAPAPSASLSPNTGNGSSATSSPQRGMALAASPTCSCSPSASTS